MKKFIVASALIASLAAPAFGQGVEDPKQKTFRSEEAKKADAEFDLQYKMRHDFGRGEQAQATKADPWSGVRASTPDVKQPAKKAAK